MTVLICCARLSPRRRGPPPGLREPSPERPKSRRPRGYRARRSHSPEPPTLVQRYTPQPVQEYEPQPAPKPEPTGGCIRNACIPCCPCAATSWSIMKSYTPICRCETPVYLYTEANIHLIALLHAWVCCNTFPIEWWCCSCASASCPAIRLSLQQSCCVVVASCSASQHHGSMQ